MTKCGQKYRRIDNCYCENNNDNKIPVAPIFGMARLITTIVKLIAKKMVGVGTNNKHNISYTPQRTYSKLLLSSQTSFNTIEG
ncbi:MAG TPA: hypothetical protein VJ729_03160 [Nitrososphaeraceae archaeon]|nr:hypothetical protein [Nitrososphaeraceae archaeon]